MFFRKNKMSKEEKNEQMINDIKEYLVHATSKEVAKLVFDIKKTNPSLAEKVLDIYKEMHKHKQKV